MMGTEYHVHNSESSITLIRGFNTSVPLPTSIFLCKIDFFYNLYKLTLKSKLHITLLNEENKGKISGTYHKVHDNLITSELNENKMFLISNRYCGLTNIV